MLVFITLISLLIAFVNFSEKFNADPLGTIQSQIIFKYQEAQIELFQYDTVANLAGIDAIYELASNGGFADKNKCGSYQNANLWSYKNSNEEYAKCIPNVEKQILVPFNKSFQDLIVTNKLNKNYFKFFANNNTKFSITGLSVLDREINISKKEPDKRIYSFKPAFTKYFDYNLSAYQAIEQFILNLEDCNNKENTKTTQNLNDCVKIKTEEFNKIIPFELKQTIITNPKIKFIDYIQTLERIKQKDCYVSFSSLKEDITFDFDVGNRVINESGNLYQTSLNFHIAEQNQNDYVPVPRVNNIKYNLKDTIKTNNLPLTPMDEIDFYKKDSKNVYFIPKSKLYNGLNLKECDYENRMFRFNLTQSKIQSYENNLEYNFAVYIEDQVEPFLSLQDFRVESKEFSQGTLLVIWKDTLSLDLKKYEIYVDNKLKKTIIPFKDVLVYDEIDWGYGNQKPFDRCRMQNAGNSLKCEYNFGAQGLFENGMSYYFNDNGEFVYVLNDLIDNQPYNIKIVAYDDDGNIFEIQKQATSKDTLPIKPLEIISPMLTVAIPPYPSIEYAAVKLNLRDPTLVLENLDGTETKDFQNKYYFYHTMGQMPSVLISNALNSGFGEPVYNVVTLAPLGLIPLKNPFRYGNQAEFLLIPVDPSINNLGVQKDNFDYNEHGEAPVSII